MKSMGKLGDVEELLSSELATLEDYEMKPHHSQVRNLQFLFIGLRRKIKKVAPVRLSYEIWAGAFVNEGSLSNLAGIIIKKSR